MASQPASGPLDTNMLEISLFVRGVHSKEQLAIAISKSECAAEHVIKEIGSNILSISKAKV